MKLTSGDTDRATAQYIEAMLMELRTMSQSSNYDMLTYLLEMAVIEASDITSGKMSVGRSETHLLVKVSKPCAEELAALFMSGELN